MPEVFDQNIIRPRQLKILEGRRYMDDQGAVGWSTFGQKYSGGCRGIQRQCTELVYIISVGNALGRRSWRVFEAVLTALEESGPNMHGESESSRSDGCRVTMQDQHVIVDNNIHGGNGMREHASWLERRN